MLPPFFPPLKEGEVHKGWIVEARKKKHHANDRIESKRPMNWLGAGEKGTKVERGGSRAHTTRHGLCALQQDPKHDGFGYYFHIFLQLGRKCSFFFCRWLDFRDFREQQAASLQRSLAPDNRRGSPQGRRAASLVSWKIRFALAGASEAYGGGDCVVVHTEKTHRCMKIGLWETTVVRWTTSSWPAVAPVLQEGHSFWMIGTSAHG